MLFTRVVAAVALVAHLVVADPPLLTVRTLNADGGVLADGSDGIRVDVGWNVSAGLIVVLAGCDPPSTHAFSVLCLKNFSKAPTAGLAIQELGSELDLPRLLCSGCTIQRCGLVLCAAGRRGW